MDPSLRRAAVLADQHHRPLRKQVGDRCRRHVVGIEAFETGLDLGQQRLFDIVAEGLRLSAAFVHVLDHHRFAGAGTGQALDHPFVHRGTDAEGKHTGLAEVGTDQARYLVRGGNAAVGDDDEGTRHAGRARHGIGLEQRLVQIGRAAAFAAVDHAEGALQIVRRSGQRGFLVEQGAAAGEQHHVEAVLGTQAGQQLAYHHLGQVQRRAMHGAGNVDDEQVFPRRHLVRQYRCGWLQREQEEVLLGAGIQQQAAGDVVARIGETQHEIARRGLDLVVGETQLRMLHVAMLQ